MKKSIFILFSIIIFALVQFTYAHEYDTSSLNYNKELQSDLQLFNQHIKPNVATWTIELKEFTHDIYRKILDNNTKLTASDIALTAEFLGVARQLIKYLIREIESIEYSTNEWSSLNSKWITIMYLQKYNLELLDNIPLSKHDYEKLKENVKHINRLEKKANEYFFYLQKISQ